MSSPNQGPALASPVAGWLRRSDYVARLRMRGIELVVAKAHLPLREAATLIGGAFDRPQQFGQLADAVAAFRYKFSSSKQ